MDKDMCTQPLKIMCFFKNNVYWSALLFHHQKDLFLFFYGAWETLPGRGSMCGRWLFALCQWNGWGALIRQTMQRGGTLITLCGAVWQQAWRRGTFRRGYIHIYRTNFYNLACFLLWLFCSNTHAHSFGFAADKGRHVYVLFSSSHSFSSSAAA